MFYIADAEDLPRIKQPSGEMIERDPWITCYFIGAGTTPNANDAATIQRFNNYKIRVHFVNESAHSVVEALLYDFVFVSETISSNNLGTGYREFKKPLMLQEGGCLDTLRWSPNNGVTTATETDIDFDSKYKHFRFSGNADVTVSGITLNVSTSLVADVIPLAQHPSSSDQKVIAVIPRGAALDSGYTQKSLGIWYGLWTRTTALAPAGVELERNLIKLIRQEIGKEYANNLPIAFTDPQEDGARFRLPDSKLLMPELLLGRKPTGLVEIDWNNPIISAYKPIGIFLLDLNHRKNLVNNASLDLSTTKSFNAKSVTVDGNNNSYLDLLPDSSVIPLDGVTIICAGDFRAGTSNNNCGFGIADGATGARCGTHLPYSDGTVYWDFGDYSVDGRITYDGGAVGYHQWVFTHGNGEKAIWKDGIQVSQSVGAETRISLNAEFGLGYHAASTKPDANYVDYTYFYIFPVLPDSVIRALAKNPYQFLKPKAQAPLALEHQGAGSYLPDARMEVPELLIPKRRPTGAVTIDWGKSITKGLIKYNIFQQNPRDLVTGFSGALQGGAVITPDGLFCDGVDSEYYDAEAGIPDLTDMTIFISMNAATDYTAWTTLLSASRSNDVEIIRFYWQSTTGSILSPKGNAGVFTATTDTVDKGVRNQTFAVRSQSETDNFWINGVKDPTSKSRLYGMTQMTKMYVGSRGGSSYTKATIHCVAMYNRALSDAEVKALHDNPYRFLIPE